LAEQDRGRYCPTDDKKQCALFRAMHHGMDPKHATPQACNVNTSDYNDTWVEKGAKLSVGKKEPTP